MSALSRIENAATFKEAKAVSISLEEVREGDYLTETERPKNLLKSEAEVESLPPPLKTNLATENRSIIEAIEQKSIR